MIDKYEGIIGAAKREFDCLSEDTKDKAVIANKKLFNDKMARLKELRTVISYLLEAGTLDVDYR